MEHPEKGASRGDTQVRTDAERPAVERKHRGRNFVSGWEAEAEQQWCMEGRSCDWGEWEENQESGESRTSSAPNGEDPRLCG